MFVNLKYPNNNYGTGYPTDDYKSSISEGKDHDGNKYLELEFEFSKGVEGKTSTGPRPECLTLHLTEGEALKLASAILAYSQHPFIRGKKTAWRDPRYMSRLEPDVWTRKLDVSIKKMKISMVNKSNALVGQVVLLLKFETRNSAGEVKECSSTLRKTVDLAPDSGLELDLVKGDFPGESSLLGIKVVKVEVVEATGFMPP